MADGVRAVAATFKLVVDDKGFAKANSGIEGVKVAAEKVAGKAGLGGVSAAADKAGKASAGAFGAIKGSLSGIAGKFGGGGIAGEVEQFAGKLLSASSVAVGFAVGIGAVAAGLAALGDRTAKHAMEMKRSAEMAGVDTQAFQELAFAAKESGIDVETLTHGLGKLSKSVTAAMKGGEGAKAFKNLGVEFKGTDGKARPLADIMADIADRTQAMGKTSDRAGKLMGVLGKSAQSYIPWLNKGSAEMKHATQMAREYGIVLSEETIQQAAQYSKSKKKIGAVFEGIKMQLGSAVLPMLGEVGSKLADLLASKRVAIIDGLKMGLSTALALFEAIGGAVSVIGRGWAAVPDSIKTALLPITKMLDVIEEIEDYKEHLAGRFSARGAEEAKSQGSAALDKYIREKGFGAKGDAEGIQARGGRAGMQKYLSQRGEAGGLGGLLDKIGMLAAGEAPNINTNAQQARQDQWVNSFQISHGRGPTEAELGGFYASDERRSRTNLAARDELAPLNVSSPSGGGWYSPQAPYLPPHFAPGGQSQGPVPVTGEVKIKIEVGEGLQSVNDTQAQIRSANASF